MKNLREFTDAMHEAAEGGDVSKWDSCDTEELRYVFMHRVKVLDLAMDVQERPVVIQTVTIRLALIAAEIAERVG